MDNETLSFLSSRVLWEQRVMRFPSLLKMLSRVWRTVGFFPPTICFRRMHLKIHHTVKQSKVTYVKESAITFWPGMLPVTLSKVADQWGGIINLLVISYFTQLMILMSKVLCTLWLSKSMIRFWSGSYQKRWSWKSTCFFQSCQMVPLSCISLRRVRLPRAIQHVGTFVSQQVVR